ncbi:MAG TPA: sigma-70 family RNA polymerase sigma factor [Verrucomicrobiae bacterium]|nr:sigma-70 family RNA polymerase sigma factor [Verrucomicrobiae bacterium]
MIESEPMMCAEAATSLAGGTGSLGVFAPQTASARRAVEPARTVAGEPAFDLRDCLARIGRGDEEAAAGLIQRVYPLVMKIVRRHLPRRDAEEDVAQEIYAKIFASLDTFRHAAPFEHWVSRVAVNVCLNRLRAERSRPELRWADLSEEQASAIEAVTTGQAQRPDRDVAARDFVEQLLGTLCPQDRIILRMLDMEELSVKEISARTGWSGALIRVRAFRARRKLNREFSNLWKRGEP